MIVSGIHLCIDSLLRNEKKKKNTSVIDDWVWAIGHTKRYVQKHMQKTENAWMSYAKHAQAPQSKDIKRICLANALHIHISKEFHVVCVVCFYLLLLFVYGAFVHFVQLMCKYWVRLWTMRMDWVDAFNERTANERPTVRLSISLRR